MRICAKSVLYSHFAVKLFPRRPLTLNTGPLFGGLKCEHPSILHFLFGGSVNCGQRPPIYPKEALSKGASKRWPPTYRITYRLSTKKQQRRKRESEPRCSIFGNTQTKRIGCFFTDLPGGLQPPSPNRELSIF